MFNYRCPSCGKHHTVEKNFEQPFEAQCLRCGARISVTEELIHQTNLPARSTHTLPKREEAIILSPTDSSIRAVALHRRTRDRRTGVAGRRFRGIGSKESPRRKQETTREKSSERP